MSLDGSICAGKTGNFDGSGVAPDDDCLSEPSNSSNSESSNSELATGAGTAAELVGCLR